jgi:hypothetical protein
LWRRSERRPSDLPLRDQAPPLILGLSRSRERLMARTPPEPSGDYEYDLVHEPDLVFEVPHEEHHDSSPPPKVDPEGDYGYDEAHDL